MKKTIWTIIIIIVLILIVWLVAASGDNDSADDNADPIRTALAQRAQQAGLEVTDASVLVDLEEQNASGVAGVAVLTELDNSQTRVAVWLDDSAGNSRPVHIHSGTCSNLGDVLHALSNVDDNFSNTTVIATLERLEAQLPLAINAHESGQAIENYIACGNIDLGQGVPSSDDEEQDDETATTTDDESDTGSEDEASATIRYTDTGFVPANLLVARGTTVRFLNDSSGKMWVASDDHPTHTLLSEFDQLVSVDSGLEYEFTFEDQGSWGYHNHVSANHTGTIKVQ